MRGVGSPVRTRRGTLSSLADLHALSASESSGWVGVAWFVGTFLRTYRNPYP